MRKERKMVRRKKTKRMRTTRKKAKRTKMRREKWKKRNRNRFCSSPLPLLQVHWEICRSRPWSRYEPRKLRDRTRT